MTTTVTALSLATATSGSYMLAELSGDTHVPLGPALAGLIFVTGIVLYIDRRMKGVENGQELSKKAVQELTDNQITLIQNQRVIMDNVKELNTNLSGRPCQKTNDKNCPVVL